MTDIEIMQILINAKQLGITHADVENYKTKLETVPELKPEEIVKPLSPFDGLSDEEILYYATPFFDELQAKKEAQKTKLSEGEDLNGQN